MTNSMKAAVFVEPGRMEVHEVPRPVIEKPDDAIVRVIKACVCGSDLWWFRGISQRPHGSLTGHEAIGIIDEIGDEVRDLQPGDLVIVPFTHGCGHCAACRAGFEANCVNAEPGGNAGYQAEYLRAAKADTALVKVPGDPKSYGDATLDSLLTLADVMATGYHAAVSAEVRPGDTAVVFGDGAVGLSGVLSARMRGASRIIAMSRHEDRAALARAFGATDIVPERGDDAVARVMELTYGDGADAVLECVGSAQSIETAVRVGRPGSTVGRVGVPHDAHIDVDALFWRNIGLKGGPASVATYDREVLLPAVLSGMIEPGLMFTGAFDLYHVQDAYEAMDQRRAIKSLINISEI
ncbi:zinc-dependent alcohol dehydrogenase family protein [Bifidobacterium parmae]|uniref:Alcohol dehydrogenase n=1 Tax=Bifidobacterium parmae TaxID=361854 RepID=A0A2N5IWC6_9BIFI|nr:zinc-dependent alcohol dehydrogenase family protein [Bifidobacterium parmae]PLS26262.1 alcohol dehydrogenase [Bifidobacterium parmae]